MKHYIYILIDPESGQCRYVGKTVAPRRRLRAHINRSRRSPGATRVNSWIAGLLSRDAAPEMEIIETAGEDWEEAEQFWIAYFKYIGTNLTNMTAGGGAHSGSATKEEARAKISEAAKLQFSIEENRIAAASYARKAWRDPSYRARRAKTMKAISASAEYREKQSIAKKLKWQDPEYAANVIAAQKGADHSTGAKKMWERPEYREKQRLARERRYGASAKKWPDQTVVCIASGPSLTQEDCQLVKASGLPCVAVNTSWKMAPFCQVIYAGDDNWWVQYGKEIDIPAERWTCLENTARLQGINRHGKFRGVTNSGARALEFIIDEGAKRILLVGFDCSLKGGTHWHGDHAKTGNPDSRRVHKWQGHFLEIARIAKKSNIEIINCSRYTELSCFDRAALKEALADDCNINRNMDRSCNDHDRHIMPG